MIFFSKLKLSNLGELMASVIAIITASKFGATAYAAVAAGASSGLAAVGTATSAAAANLTPILFVASTTEFAAGAAAAAGAAVSSIAAGASAAATSAAAFVTANAVPITAVTVGGTGVVIGFKSFRLSEEFKQYVAQNLELKETNMGLQTQVQRFLRSINDMTEEQKKKYQEINVRLQSAQALRARAEQIATVRSATEAIKELLVERDAFIGECARTAASKEEEDHTHTVNDCCVCLCEKSTHLFARCGHMCVCEGCAIRLKNAHGLAKCPSCCQRTAATRVIKVYLT